MKIAALGLLRPDPIIREWLRSESIVVPYFDGRTLEFVIDGIEDSEEENIETAVTAFLDLNSKDRQEAGKYVFANYQKIAEQVDEDDLGCQIETPDDVWKHIQPSEIYICKRPRRDKEIYIQINANCDWEPEHGLQIVYRKGCQLSRVSDQDGHLTHTDAYDLPEEQDRIVS